MHSGASSGDRNSYFCWPVASDHTRIDLSAPTVAACALNHYSSTETVSTQ
jgi:hypothetical protein